MTFIPHRDCQFSPRTPWYKRLASALTLGAYISPAPPQCNCRDCWTHRRAIQIIFDGIDRELGPEPPL